MGSTAPADSRLVADPDAAARRGANPVVIDGDVARIQLAGGWVAVVDAADLALLAGRRWCAFRSRRTVYAYANRPKVFMHRLVAGAGPGEQIDHRDGDGLNNRRTNLRRATTSQNGGNMAPRPSRHGYKGVTPARSRWAARIMVGYRRRHLGTFDSPEEAARAYDEAAREAWGEYARTNFPAIPAAG